MAADLDHGPLAHRNPRDVVGGQRLLVVTQSVRWHTSELPERAVDAGDDAW